MRRGLRPGSGCRSAPESNCPQRPHRHRRAGGGGQRARPRRSQRAWRVGRSVRDSHHTAIGHAANSGGVRGGRRIVCGLMLALVCRHTRLATRVDRRAFDPLAERVGPRSLDLRRRVGGLDRSRRAIASHPLRSLSLVSIEATPGTARHGLARRSRRRIRLDALRRRRSFASPGRSIVRRKRRVHSGRGADHLPIRYSDRPACVGALESSRRVSRWSSTRGPPSSTARRAAERASSRRCCPASA